MPYSILILASAEGPTRAPRLFTPTSKYGLPHQRRTLSSSPQRQIQQTEIQISSGSRTTYGNMYYVHFRKKQDIVEAVKIQPD